MYYTYVVKVTYVLIICFELMKDVRNNLINYELVLIQKLGMQDYTSIGLGIFKRTYTITTVTITIL